jgi:hypothetical protein
VSLQPRRPLCVSLHNDLPKGETIHFALSVLRFRLVITHMSIHMSVAVRTDHENDTSASVPVNGADLLRVVIDLTATW